MIIMHTQTESAMWGVGELWYTIISWNPYLKDVLRAGIFVQGRSCPLLGGRKYIESIGKSSFGARKHVRCIEVCFIYRVSFIGGFTIIQCSPHSSNTLTTNYS